MINNIRFPGQYYDAETGLHYNRYRYYDPSIGRYVSADPIGQAGGANVYSYVGSSPLNLADPYGLENPYALNGPYGQANHITQNPMTPDQQHVLRQMGFFAGVGTYRGGPLGGLAGLFEGFLEGIGDLKDYDGDGTPDYRDDTPFGYPSAKEPLPCDPLNASCAGSTPPDTCEN